MTTWRRVGMAMAIAMAVLGAARPVESAPLSALDPAGDDARVIANLFWWMAVAAAVVWAAAVGFLLYCLRRPTSGRATPSPRRIVAGGGVVLPALLLALLVGTALPPIEGLVDGPAPPQALRIRIDGEQWWWRVRYPRPDGTQVELANEVRVPRGRRAHLELTSDNVIHAFWVPSLAGKIDLLPGRTTYLSLEPTEAGTFRGVCAEYCGTSHAHMSFQVVVVEPDAFQSWLTEMAAPAATAASSAAGRGASEFIESGCGACHTVRGTAADGTIGPDLTHVAARYGPAAAPVPGTADALETWLRRPDHVKPGALMPPFASLGDARISSLATYLRGLR